MLGWPSQQYGSFERFLVALTCACEARGFESHLVFPAPPASEAFTADVSARIHAVPLARGPLDRRAIGGLARVLAVTDSTHVHAHFGLDMYLALAAAARRGIPVDHRFATKHIMPGTSRATLSRTRHRWIDRSTGTIFAVSSQVAEGLAALGMARRNILVCHLGVDAEAYRPDPERRRAARSALGIPDGVRIVLSTSHLRPGKGAELLPRLAAGLDASPGGTLVLLAGAGPGCKEIRQRAAALGLGDDRFRMLGVREDVPELLAAVDLFVFPTTTTEGLGLGAVEALAAGVPVVASAVSDLPRLLEGAARFVAPGDEAALLCACRELLADDAGRAALAHRGRELATRRLGMRAAVDIHVARYLGAADT